MRFCHVIKRLQLNRFNHRTATQTMVPSRRPQVTQTYDSRKLAAQFLYLPDSS